MSFLMAYMLMHSLLIPILIGGTGALTLVQPGVAIGGIVHIDSPFHGVPAIGTEVIGVAITGDAILGTDTIIHVMDGTVATGAAATGVVAIGEADPIMVLPS